MEFSSNMPIYLQVVNDIKQRIAKKEIAPGSRLPAAVEVAMAYQINPNTVQRIFKELEQQGICYTKRGIGTYIVDDEGLAARLAHELVGGLTRDYLCGMKSLGFTVEDIIEEIKSAEK